MREGEEREREREREEVESTRTQGNLLNYMKSKWDKDKRDKDKRVPMSSEGVENERSMATILEKVHMQSWRSNRCSEKGAPITFIL